MNKREFIKKYVDEMENEEMVDFIYYFMEAHLVEVWKRKNLEEQEQGAS